MGMPYYIPSSTQQIRSVYVKILRQRQHPRRLRNTRHPIRLHDITLRINMHLGHCAVELHVAFADVAAVLDCFDAFADVVGLHCAGVDGCLGDEDYGGAGEGGLLYRLGLVGCQG